ncbi:MAG: hypothetical protein PWP40_2487 [Rhodocyclaceae bacterium]|nr:hypothetical protein [Rhodocyclaceae bacterium]
MTAPANLPPWPTVPDCHGWLSLDARGNWRLKDERVEHGGLIAFLNANYASDDEGNWLVHNGPQRVHVALEAAPWILRLHPDGTLHAQTGRLARPAPPVLVDQDGCVYMQTDLGAAAIDDRDLATFVAELEDEHGARADEATLLALLAGGPVRLYWRGFAVAFAPTDEIPTRLAFRRRSGPTETLDAPAAPTL